MRRTLKDYQKQFGIKRIDFTKIRPSGIEEQYEDDKLRCPYCECEIEYESEETEDILRGEPWQCPECEKWFFVTADITINTTCTPMEDKVIKWRRHIENSYNHSDELERLGFDFPEKQYGFIEWEIYKKYAKPLFENQGGDRNGTD